MTINKKVLLGFIIVIVVAVMVMAVASRIYIDSMFDRYVQDHRTVLKHQLEHMLSSYYITTGSWDGVESIIVNRQRRPGASSFWVAGESLLVTDAAGMVVFDSLNDRVGELISQRIIDQGEPMMINGEQVGTLILQPRDVRTVMTLEDEFSQSVMWVIIWGGVAAIIVGTVLSYPLTRQISRPLEALGASARRFADRDYSHRVKITSRDEVGQLANAFNFMAASVERTEKLRSKLVADVSHELRTPLTTLQGNLEALQSGKMEANSELISSLHDEVLRLSRLASDLEAINLAEAGKLPLRLSEASVGETIKRAAFVFEYEARERQISLAVSNTDVAWMFDQDRMIQVVTNLLANAFRFTPDEGEIGIEVRINDGLIIEVRDSGVGIKEEDLPFVFERFYKSSTSRGDGSGLGLSIAKSFVEAHGGRINVRNGKVGSVFTIWLPVLDR